MSGYLSLHSMSAETIKSSLKEKNQVTANSVKAVHADNQHVSIQNLPEPEKMNTLTLHSNIKSIEQELDDLDDDTLLDESDLDESDPDPEELDESSDDEEEHSSTLVGMKATMLLTLPIMYPFNEEAAIERRKGLRSLARTPDSINFYNPFKFVSESIAEAKSSKTKKLFPTKGSFRAIMGSALAEIEKISSSNIVYVGPESSIAVQALDVSRTLSERVEGLVSELSEVPVLTTTDESGQVIEETTVDSLLNVRNWLLLEDTTFNSVVQISVDDSYLYDVELPILQEIAKIEAMLCSYCEKNALKTKCYISINIAAALLSEVKVQELLISAINDSSYSVYGLGDKNSLSDDFEFPAPLPSDADDFEMMMSGLDIVLIKEVSRTKII